MILIVISSIISTSLILYITFKPFNFATYINLIDKANQDKIKQHKYDTPKTGGIVLFILSTQIFLIYFFLNNTSKEIISIYLIISSFFIIGLIDDYINFSALGRLVSLSIFCCLSLYLSDALIIQEIYFDTLNKKIEINSFDFVFTVFCIIALQNAFNFADGSNGNLLTIALTILAVLLFIKLSIILIVLTLVILLLLISNVKNFIFLGNNGSSIISCIIAISIIIYNKEYYYYLSGEKILILLLLPGIDMIRVTFIRIYNNKNPFIGDRNHFHHIVFDNIKTIYWIPFYFFFIITLFVLSSYIEAYLVLFFQLFFYFYLLKKYN